MKWLSLLTILFFLDGCTKPSKFFCEQTGGKWANINSQCIRPSCAKTKTCGKWANPAHFCDKVKKGDSKDNVRFWLGEPNFETPNLMTWTDKLGENEVKAEFNHNVLEKFECPNKR